MTFFTIITFFAGVLVGLCVNVTEGLRVVGFLVVTAAFLVVATAFFVVVAAGLAVVAETPDGFHTLGPGAV